MNFGLSFLGGDFLVSLNINLSRSGLPVAEMANLCCYQGAIVIC